MNEQRVMVVEPHNYHYEVLPGVCYYFWRLNYKISLFVRESFRNSSVFSYVPFFSSIEVIYYDEDRMLQDAYFQNIAEEYDLLFFNSLDFFHDGNKERILDYIGKVPNTRYGFMGIYHNLSIMNDDDIPYIIDGRIFSLSHCEYKGFALNRISTCYYGDFETINSDRIENTIIAVGNGNDRRLLEIEVGKLRKYLKKNHIRVLFIGKTNRVKDVIKCILFCFSNIVKMDYLTVLNVIMGSDYISYLGELSFEKMYSYINKCKFTLFISDYKNEDNPFLGGKTSGTKQLSIGFCKPCILNKSFALSFDLPLDSCVIYEDKIEELVNDLKKNDDYNTMIKRLEVLKETLLSESLQNIKKCLLSSCSKYTKGKYGIDFAD